MCALVAALTPSGADDGGPGVALAAEVPAPLLSALVGVAATLTTACLLALRRAVVRVALGATRPGWPAGRVAVAALAAALPILVLAAVCDAFPLAAAGYLPLLVVGSLFSSDVREAWGRVVEPGMLAQLGIIGAAILTILAVLAALDAARGDSPLPRWLHPDSAARWGRVAAIAAIAIPTVYAATRISWSLGWSVGFDLEAYVRSGGDVRQGLALAAGALLGALLTTGLMKPWGERFWRWVPVVGGRPVPVPLAVVPASVVAAMLLPAGLSMMRTATEQIGIGAILSDLGRNWAAVGVTFLWPLWSLSLAATTLAYVARRRREIDAEQA